MLPSLGISKPFWWYVGPFKFLPIPAEGPHGPPGAHLESAKGFGCHHFWNYAGLFWVVFFWLLLKSFFPSRLGSPWVLVLSSFQRQAPFCKHQSLDGSCWMMRNLSGPCCEPAGGWCIVNIHKHMQNDMLFFAFNNIQKSIKEKFSFTMYANWNWVFWQIWGARVDKYLEPQDDKLQPRTLDAPASTLKTLRPKA